MFTSEVQDPSVLGKRSRDGVEEQAKLVDQPIVDKTSHAANEEDDDDVGPMPMPASGSAMKKKRKGTLNGSFFNPPASNDTRYLFPFLHQLQFYHMSADT